MNLEKFYFIRHGETAWNAKNIVMGQQDIFLNNIGINQARHAQKYFAKVKIKTIFSSPLMRAQQTANIINEVLRCPMIVVDELKECNWGEFEGNLQHGSRLFNVVLQKWWQNDLGDYKVEKFPDFLSRINIGLNHIAKHGENFLIVAHGGVYTILKHILHVSNYNHLSECIPVCFKRKSKENNMWSCNFL